MNEYKRAFNSINKFITGFCDYKLRDLFTKELETINELIDRATPKETIVRFDDSTICPCCLHLIYIDNFCSNCGQAISKKKRKKNEKHY